MSRPLKKDADGNLIISINPATFIKLFIIAVVTFSAIYVEIPGLTTSSRACLMLFVGAAGLWVLEIIPPFATAIVVVVLSMYVFGMPGGSENLITAGYEAFLNPFASPVLVLFFGGFILAIAATKHGLDIRLAKAFIKPFGKHPNMVLLAVILTTGLFSMFMSNTATTAMMIAIMTPLFTDFKGRRHNFKKALVLSIPFAANIGGVGTLIGTPPNAVAASVLASMGDPISFLGWMEIGVPLALVLLLILWIVLITLFSVRTDEFSIHFGENLELTWDLVVVVITFAVTVLLWLTEPLHGIPAAMVALIPVMVFTMFGIIDAKDLKKLDWDVLILVAGGLTLGVAMKSSGLSDILANLLTHFPFSSLSLLIIVVLFSIILSNFMSNTSAANVIIPIVTSLAVIDPKIGALGVALACSLAMSLPISTPPNAIAFATHAIDTKELVKYGTLMSFFGVVCILILLFFLQST